MQRSGDQAQAATTPFIPAQRTHAAPLSLRSEVGPNGYDIWPALKLKGKHMLLPLNMLLYKLNAVQVQI